MTVTIRILEDRAKKEMFPYGNSFNNKKDKEMGFPMQAQLSRGGGGDLPESDEFRMYSLKIKRCTKTRSHDWTECPYAHRGEKARRRDPCRFPYHGIACPEFRQLGDCRKGQNCNFAHGVFEFWLHPMRYRTRPCKAGLRCQRKVCFFAHTPEQLRVDPWCYNCCCVCQAKVNGMAVNSGLRVGPVSVPFIGEYMDLSQGMRMLKIFDREERKEGFGDNGGGDQQKDLPNIDWICELLK